MKRYIIGLITILISSLLANSQSVEYSLDDKSHTVNLSDTEYSCLQPTTDKTTTYTFSNSKFDYKHTAEWGKYKALSAVGWSFFGVGLPVTLTGLVGCAIDAFEGGGNISTPWAALTLTGGALTISSIPILISAYHYRNKAKKMSLDIGVTKINTPTVTRTQDFSPALSFALNF